METLIFKHKGQAIAMKIMGGLLVVLAISNIIFLTEKMNLIRWILNIIVILYGIFILTPWSMSNKSILEAQDGFLKIKWRNWLREIIIPDAEIEKIILEKTAVIIMRKGKKAIRLDIHEMEKDQKIGVYNFLMEYVKQRSLIIERR
jgi:hypothetical protein